MTFQVGSSHLSSPYLLETGTLRGRDRVFRPNRVTYQPRSESKRVCNEVVILLCNAPEGPNPIILWYFKSG